MKKRLAVQNEEQHHLCHYNEWNFLTHSYNPSNWVLKNVSLKLIREVQKTPRMCSGNYYATLHTIFAGKNVCDHLLVPYCHCIKIRRENNTPRYSTVWSKGWNQNTIKKIAFVTCWRGQKQTTKKTKLVLLSNI